MNDVTHLNRAEPNIADVWGNALAAVHMLNEAVERDKESANPFTYSDLEKVEIRARYAWQLLSDARDDLVSIENREGWSA